MTSPFVSWYVGFIVVHFLYFPKNLIAIFFYKCWTKFKIVMAIYKMHGIISTYNMLPKFSRSANRTQKLNATLVSWHNIFMVISKSKRQILCRFWAFPFLKCFCILNIFAFTLIFSLEINTRSLCLTTVTWKLWMHKYMVKWRTISPIFFDKFLLATVLLQ